MYNNETDFMSHLCATSTLLFLSWLPFHQIFSLTFYPSFWDFEIILGEQVIIDSIALMRHRIIRKITIKSLEHDYDDLVSIDALPDKQWNQSELSHLMERPNKITGAL